MNNCDWLFSQRWQICKICKKGHKKYSSTVRDIKLDYRQQRICDCLNTVDTWDYHEQQPTKTVLGGFSYLVHLLCVGCGLTVTAFHNYLWYGFVSIVLQRMLICCCGPENKELVLKWYTMLPLSMQLVAVVYRYTDCHWFTVCYFGNFICQLHKIKLKLATSSLQIQQWPSLYASIDRTRQRNVCGDWNAASLKNTNAYVLMLMTAVGITSV